MNNELTPEADYPEDCCDQLRDVTEKLCDAFADIERLQRELNLCESFHKVAVADRNKAFHDIEQLRRSIDNIKVRAYELGQVELHDMAWEALKNET